jgi:hypothetical protein
MDVYKYRTVQYSTMFSYYRGTLRYLAVHKPHLYSHSTLILDETGEAYNSIPIDNVFRKRAHPLGKPT